MLEFLAHFIISLIEQTGYAGVFFLMTIESALVPMPSEVTMPFAGYLVSIGKMNLLWVTIVGAVGNLVGSLAAYALGYWGEETFIRGFIKKYGKFLLIKESEYDRAELWFRKHGEPIVFISRLLPAVRTFISLPAGVAHMNLRRFIIYTTIGSLIWSFILTYIGVVLGNNWQALGPFFHKFDGILAVVLVLAVVFFVLHRLERLPRIFKGK